MAFSERFDCALDLAHELHRKQVRKGTAIPYIVHLMAVAALIAESGGTEDQVIAGLLHDAVEDQGGLPIAERIRSEFGADVHRIVMACTDSLAEDAAAKLPWEERKKAYLGHLDGAPHDVRLVSAADKLHNARSIVADLRRDGEAAFTRFNGGKAGTLWYYQELVKKLGDNWPHPIVAELARTVDDMIRLSSKS